MRKRFNCIICCIGLIAAILSVPALAAGKYYEPVTASVSVDRTGTYILVNSEDNADTTVKEIKEHGTFEKEFGEPGSYIYFLGTHNNASGEIFQVTFHVFADEQDNLSVITEMKEIHTGEKLPIITPDPVTPSGVCTDDPPVSKVVTGLASTKDVFMFRLRANIVGNPMPIGTVNGVKEAAVYGAGEVEFGVITFTEPGTYDYTVTETNTGIAYYNYDTSVYGIHYEITEGQDGQLICHRTFLKDGVPVPAISVITFNNVYNGKTIPTPTPGAYTDNGKGIIRTGDSSNQWVYITIAVVSLLMLGTVLFTMISTKKKKAENKEEPAIEVEDTNGLNS